MKQADMNTVMISGKIDKMFDRGDNVSCTLESVNTYKKKGGEEGEFTIKPFITTWGDSKEQLRTCGQEGESIIVIGKVSVMKGKEGKISTVIQADRIMTAQMPASQKEAFPEGQDDDDDLPF